MDALSSDHFEAFARICLHRPVIILPISSNLSMTALKPSSGKYPSLKAINNSVST
jgi:hypothetical protein